MTVTVEINGRTHTIDDDDSRKVGGGGEGKVYPMPGNNTQVIKLYGTPLDTSTQEGSTARKKLQSMIQKPPVTDDANGNKVLAWPQAIAYRTVGTRRMLAGFTMHRIGGSNYQEIFNYWNPGTRREIVGPTATQRDIDLLLEGIARNVIMMVKGIHGDGCIIGDINEKNFYVAPNGLIAVMDCDSFQVRDLDGTYYPCPVGIANYTSPRVLAELEQICRDPGCPRQNRKKSYNCVIRTPDDDSFALAVMLYKLLMQGRHPYDGAVRLDASVQEQILSVRPPCVTEDLRHMPGPAKERWQKLTDAWQTYFRESLTGTEYRDEDHIPATDRIFHTRGFRGQVVIETEESAKIAREAREAQQRALEERQRAREELYAREAQQREREELYARELRELRETQQREREAQELREARIAIRRSIEATRDPDPDRRAAAVEGLERAWEATRGAFHDETEWRREVEAAAEAYLEAEREAAQNKPSTPTNVCPNCLNPFRQGEVYCQTANCITVLQTKTKLCRGRGCRKGIPYTAAFCRHCGLRQ